MRTVKTNVMDIRPCLTCGDPMAPVYECSQNHYNTSAIEPLETNSSSVYAGSEDVIHRKMTFYHAKNEWMTSPDELDPITITVMYTTRGKRGYVCGKCRRSDEGMFECCGSVEWFGDKNFRVQIKGLLDFNPEELKFMAKNPRKFHGQILEFLETAISRNFQTMAGQFVGLKRELKYHLSPGK